MEILIDYSNVVESDRRNGVTYVLDRVFSALRPEHIDDSLRLLFRLYDGWYESQKLTRRAQQIASDLPSYFPTSKSITDGTTSKKLVVNAEMAYSLMIRPTKHLWHTHRPRGAPAGIKCHHPYTAGCPTSANCPLTTIYQFLTSGHCPKAGCQFTPDDLLYRSEQKLVDTMLAADLFFLAHNGADVVGVVSSDDDLWPPMMTAMQLGTRIIHIHTRPPQNLRSSYSRDLGHEYTQLSL